MSYQGYLKTMQAVKYWPYHIRWLFWTALFFYNKRKYPQGDFTLKLYQSYAK